MTHEIPKWILDNNGQTAREWKARKRKELEQVRKALDVYRIGCTFTSANPNDIVLIKLLLEGIREAQSVENWGR